MDLESFPFNCGGLVIGDMGNSVRSITYKAFLSRIIDCSASFDLVNNGDKAPDADEKSYDFSKAWQTAGGMNFICFTHSLSKLKGLITELRQHGTVKTTNLPKGHDYDDLVLAVWFPDEAVKDTVIRKAGGVPKSDWEKKQLSKVGKLPKKSKADVEDWD